MKKFLLKRMPNLNFPSKPNKISQFYLDDDDGYIKYKGIENEDNTVSYYCSSKEKGGDEEQFLEEISSEEFIKKYKESDRKINKMRFSYQDEYGQNWKIDHYTMFNLLIAKVDCDHFIPADIEEAIVMEATDFPQVEDYNLADNYEV